MAGADEVLGGAEATVEETEVELLPVPLPVPLGVVLLEPDEDVLPEELGAPGARFSVALAARAAKASIVLAPDCALMNVSIRRELGLRQFTYALMAPTIPVWQCLPCEQ